MEAANSLNKKSWVQNRLELVREYHFRFLHESWIWEFFVASFVLVIQFNFFISSKIPQWFAVDLMTPLVVSYAVRYSYLRALTLSLAISFLMETHSSLPAGSRIVPTWILVHGIYYMRDMISWHHNSPWAYIFILSSIWMIVFEWFILAVIRSSSFVSWMQFAQLITSCASSIAFGIWLIKKQRKHRLVDENPAGAAKH